MKSGLMFMVPIALLEKFYNEEMIFSIKVRHNKVGI